MEFKEWLPIVISIFALLLGFWNVYRGEKLKGRFKNEENIKVSNKYLNDVFGVARGAMNSVINEPKTIKWHKKQLELINSYALDVRKMTSVAKNNEFTKIENVFDDILKYARQIEIIIDGKDETLLLDRSLIYKDATIDKYYENICYIIDTYIKNNKTYITPHDEWTSEHI